VDASGNAVVTGVVPAEDGLFDSTFPVRDVSGAVDPGPPPEE